MKHKKKKGIGGSLTRSIFARFFLLSCAFTALYLLMLVALIAFLQTSGWRPWHLGGALGGVAMFFWNDFRYETLMLAWISGIAFIFFYYWRKTLYFVDSIAQASEILGNADAEYVTLPPELAAVGEQMNRVKRESLHNARAAREAERRKNDLIVYLAHDLKTPLTSVIGYLTLLKDERQISEELQGKYLSVALDKAERLEELINEFFEITRFNLSELTLECSSVNLTRMLEQILYEFLPTLAEKNLTLKQELEPDLNLVCDVGKLERVFDNLVRNAVNYSYPDSELAVKAASVPGGVELCFCNHGKTIPQEKLSRIFEQFFRLDTARGSSTGGAGLGLAIAKEIVELHGGRIRAISVDETVEFRVFLPKEAGAAKSHSEK